MSRLMSTVFSSIQRAYGSVTRDMIKPDILDSSRTRQEDQNVPTRRRTIRNSPVYENGSYQADLHAAIEESLKITKASTQTGIKSNDVSSHDTPTPSGSQSSENIAQNYPSSNEEPRHLKELMLVNLDLIYQQQQVLLAKDREIKALRGEKDALRCRLERMERRMSLLKRPHKLTGTDTPPLTTSPAQTVPTSCHRSTVAQTKPNAVEKKAKRRLIDEPSGPTPSKLVRARRKQSFGRLGARRLVRKIHQQLNTGKQSEQNDNDNDAFTEIIETLSLTSEKLDSKNTKLDILRTTVPYHVGTRQLREELSLKPNAKSQPVEVPSWKLSPLHNSYTLEGTENLEDEVFLKRHQKPEIEEKRRKRWDIQRLREQKMHEKLERGRYSRSLLHSIHRRARQRQTDNNEESESILPTLNDIDFIEVCNKLPVTAFGYPIPNLEKREFKLPDLQ